MFSFNFVLLLTTMGSNPELFYLAIVVKLSWNSLNRVYKLGLPRSLTPPLDLPQRVHLKDYP